MAKSPKAPKPTAEETYLQRRQTEELTKLDEQANTRIKRLKRDAYSTPMGGRRDAQASARRSTAADDRLGGSLSGGNGGFLARTVASAGLGAINATAAARSRTSAQPSASASPARRPNRFRGKVATA